MTTSNNFKTVNVKVQRRELVDLLIACDACAQLNEPNLPPHSVTAREIGILFNSQAFCKFV